MKSKTLAQSNCCSVICSGCAFPDKMLAVIRFYRKEGYYNQSSETCPIAIYIGNEDGVVDDELYVEYSSSRTGPWTLIDEYIPLAGCKGTLYRPTFPFTAPTILGEHWTCKGVPMTLLDSEQMDLDSLCGNKFIRIRTKTPSGVYCRGRIVIYQVLVVSGVKELGDVLVDTTYEAPSNKVDFIYEYNLGFKHATEDGPYTCYNVEDYDHLPPDGVNLPEKPEEYENAWDLSPKVFEKWGIRTSDLANWTPRFYSTTTGVRVTRRRYKPFHENTVDKSGYDAVAMKTFSSVWTNKDLPTYIDDKKPQWWKSEKRLEENGQTQATFKKNRTTYSNFMRFCEPLDLYCVEENKICRSAQIIGASYQVLLTEGIVKNNFQNYYEDVKSYKEEYYTRQIHYMILRGYLIAKTLIGKEYFSSRFFTQRWYRVCKITPYDEGETGVPAEIDHEVCRAPITLAFSNNPNPKEADGVFLPTPLFPTIPDDATPSACLEPIYVEKDIPMGIGHIWMVN